MITPHAVHTSWTRDEVVAATGGNASGSDWTATGVSIDSRAVAEGDLFVAIVGERFDGNAYAAAALEAGAAAAVVSRRPADLPDDAPLVLVDDTLEALTALGHAARERSGATVIAVTGSVGKTGTKESLAAALSAFGSTYSSRGNLNNHIGAPLSLARLPADADYAVLELGMNHAGEIGPLSRMVRPHLAIITNVEAVHIEFFDSVAGIADAKSEIFEGLAPGGIAVLNHDNAWYERCADAARKAGAGEIVDFGRSSGTRVRLVEADVRAGGSRVTVAIDDIEMVYDLTAVGSHWAFNSVGVLACIVGLGLDARRAAEAIGSITASRGRGAQTLIGLRQGGAFRLIDEGYNASPASMTAAFAVLALTETGSGASGGPGRRIAVLGDMRELGDLADQLHEELAESLLKARPDRVFTVGPHMTRLRAALPEHLLGEHGDRSEDIASAVAAAVHSGDVVLVKGSLGTRMAPIVAALRALGEENDAPPPPREASHAA